MTPAATEAAYDSIAQWYDDWVGGAGDADDDPYFPPLSELPPMFAAVVDKPRRPR